MLPTKRSAIALARGARTGDLDDLNVVGGQDGVEGRGALGVSIADEEPAPLPDVVEVHGQVAGQLGQPLAGGTRGDPKDVDAAGRVLDDEERVQPLQGDVSK
jgi:hypothetical protein